MGALIGRSYRSMSTLLQRNFKKEGLELSIDQWVILVGLYKNDGCSQQSLAEFSRKDKASVARLIAGLESKRLVFRRHDQSDKRNKKVYLSKKAKSLQNKLLLQFDDTTHVALKGLNMQEIEITKKVLRTVLRNTENALHKAETIQ